jgi:hypothetical protein
VSEESFDTEGAPTGRLENSYDRKGNLMKVRWFDGAGNLTKTENSRYDQKNRLVELLFFDGHGAQTGRNTYEYNGDGNVTLEVNRDESDKVRGRVTYEYDGQHLATKTAFDKNGTVETKTSYSRNERGMVAEEIEEDGSGKKITDRVYGGK